ncbi:HPP family protein [Halopseudomonas pachastrellae]|nr:HPP family protein [Halopseudomonas pachastrellae]
MAQRFATLLIGPVGASAILLFSVPSGALAQPWSIFGGYLVSAHGSHAGGAVGAATAWRWQRWPLPCR